MPRAVKVSVGRLIRWSRVGLLSYVANSGTVLAQEPVAAPPDPSLRSPEQPSEDALTTAKELNRRGVALLDANDVERALEYFLKSRATFPSSKNIGNVAICLDRLGRFDEALEVYEELLVGYETGLDAEDRATIGPAMAALREKV